ncbi:sialidase family protein [Faecalimonas sp. LCP19S3_D12]
MKKRGRALALLLAATLVLGSVPGTVMAQEKSKPADSTTKEQPFWPGTGGSEKFRIPCLVALDDGTLVAGCDARWNGGADGGGLDTIVSYSKDKGENWNYTFANYLGDNGNVWNKNSTAFIDPAMATDGKKVYMIADLYPAGYALNGAVTQPIPGKSHDKDGNILLADARGWENVLGGERAKSENYTYRLEKNMDKKSESAYLIKDANGKTVEDYTVDAYFNVSKGKELVANLFEANSPFQVWPTDYLYLTTSEDGGKTWSEPSILNMRKESEQSLLVGPGRGMVTSSGRILFTAYEFTKGDKNSTAIYSDDGGKTWERGASVAGLSSEAVVTEADGKLYMFTRHGGYYISDNEGETWSERREVGLTYNLGCQLTAITYPQKIDGKTAILFAAPSSTGSRSAGKIFVGLVQEDETLDWKYTYDINNGHYAYSCLTVLPDGTVGLLYESADQQLTYKNYSIEDIAKDAAIGNIWCTDGGKFVSEVDLKSNVSKELTVNGVTTGKEVKVSSDNEKAVTATYADGKVILTSPETVKGLEQAVVTLESEGTTTKIKVNVTDSEKYEIVDLKIGDTKTYTDKTGNYEGKVDESNLDKNVADVTVEGEDAQAVETQLKAQTATSVANFDGEKKSLDSCLFTFDKVKNKENTYQISAETGEKKVYIGHRNAPKQCVSTANVTEIQLEQKDGATVVFKDTSNGSTGQLLYFWKDDTKKLHFDRNSTDHANCHLELYQKANTATETELPGYQKVTTLNQITDGGQYLIAAKATDGSYYVVNPSSTDKNYEHVAKVVKEEVAVKPEVAVQLGTSAQFDGEKEKISSCLFTFDKQDNGKYIISSTTASGQKVYLTPKTATTANTPLTTSGASVDIMDRANGKVSFRQDGEGGAGGTLYFHREADKLHFDRQGEPDQNCEFELYKQSENADGRVIKGYQKVNELSQISDNGQYLVAAKASDNNYYLLNPAQGDNKYNYVAKVTNEMYEGETTAAKTEITITGKAEGKTSVTIGDVAYYIIVQNDVKEVALKLGETYNLVGKILKEEGDVNSITKEARSDMPPYKAITTVEEGTYLFGNDTHIMLNSQSTVSEAPKSLGMAAANFSTGEYAESAWTITKVDSGYTMKDVNGKYVNISGQDVELKDTPQTLLIKEKENGRVSVSNSNMYLNNWANSNNRVAAYNQDNNTWYFYKASSGNVVTAEAVGKVTLVTEGTTYKITIKEHESQECEHSYKWEVTKEPTCTEKGVETGTCSKCDETTTREIPALEHTEELQGAKEATCTEAGYTGDKVCKVCGTVVEKGEAIEALGHQFGGWTVEKEATETETGLEVRTCKREGCDVKETREIPKLPVAPEEVDKSALEKYYNECLAYYKEADYTADSWKGYQTAMDNAKAVLEDEDATEQDVKGSIIAIKDAAQNLKKVSNVTKPDGNKNEQNKPAKTGDAASAVPFMLGMAGCLGAAVEVIRRRFGK